MTTYAKIKCQNCGNTTRVYGHDMKQDSNFMCPFCLERMTDKQWKSLVDAFFTLNDTNYQAVKAHNEYPNKPFFVCSLESKHIPANKMK